LRRWLRRFGVGVWFRWVGRGGGAGCGVAGGGVMVVGASALVEAWRPVPAGAEMPLDQVVSRAGISASSWMTVPLNGVGICW
jgi:hypothetical protein